MPDEIINVKEKLGDLVGERNPILADLEKRIALSTRELENSTATLRVISEELDEAKKAFEKAKITAPNFRNDLKSLGSESYQEIMTAIASAYDIQKMITDIEASLAEFMEKKRVEIEDYKGQISEEEADISRLSGELKTLQNKLNTQKALSEELKSYMAMTQEESLNLSKKQVFDLLSKFIDESDRPVFAEGEVSPAALLVMFKDSIDLEQKSGKTVSAVFADAFGQVDLEPVEPVVTDMSLPTIEEATITKMEEQPPVIAEENIIEPVPIPVAEVYRENNVIPFPTMEREETISKTPDVFGPHMDGFVNFDEEEPFAEEDIEDDPKLDDLINYLESGKDEEAVVIKPNVVSHTPEEEARYEANVRKLQSLGLKGDVSRYPITFYNVTPEYIEEMIELANSYGIKLKTIGDVAKLCGTKNIQTYLDEALEKNPEGLGNKSLQNVIYAADKFGKGPKSTNFALKKYLENNPILESLDGTKEDANLGSAGYINLINLQGILEDALEKNAYAYIINGKSFSKKRVERVLTRLLASDAKATDEELLLIALTYDSQLGSIEEIAAIDNELHARLNADRGRVLGGMAA